MASRTSAKTSSRAFETAKKDLRQCYSKEGILAGLKRFDDYWARDSFFASLGSCSINDFGAVKKNLLLFLEYQKEDGQLPRRIDRYLVWLKYFRIRIKRKALKPRYTTSLMYCYSVDQNSLFIISLLEYVKTSKDIIFLKKVYSRAKKAMDWNFMNDKSRNLLLEEGYFANWEDTVFWRGQLLYTNILHCWALKCFAEISEMTGKDSRYYRGLAERVKDRINKRFWNQSYYEKTSRKLLHYFCIDANMLAIISGVADKAKANRILEYMKKQGLDSEVPLRSTYPRYPLWRHSPARLLTMSAGYHDIYQWIWVSCFDILARHKLGRKKEAAEKLENLSRKISEFRGVYEVYFKGKPVKGIFLMSEQPFAWSAGMFIYTYNLLKKQKLLK